MYEWSIKHPFVGADRTVQAESIDDLIADNLPTLISLGYKIGDAAGWTITDIRVSEDPHNVYSNVVTIKSRGKLQEHHERYEAEDYEAVVRIRKAREIKVGRPEVGPATNVRLGDELTAKVDAARRDGESRAAAIRRLLAAALA